MLLSGHVLLLSVVLCLLYSPWCVTAAAADISYLRLVGWITGSVNAVMWHYVCVADVEM